MKPDFFKDEHIAELPFWVRLLYAGLWCMADKQGKLEDSPKRIKAELFPYEIKIDIEEGLNILATNKHDKNRPFIIRYVNNNNAYIKILKWEEHQRPHHTEKESEIPEPTEEELNNINKSLEKGMEKGMGKGKQLNPSAALSNRYLTVKSNPPSIEEVREYIKANNLPIDPEAFRNHYEANGWVQGHKGKPVVNWKACCQTWKRNIFDTQSKENAVVKSLGVIAAEKKAEEERNRLRGAK